METIRDVKQWNRTLPTVKKPSVVHHVGKTSLWLFYFPVMWFVVMLYSISVFMGFVYGAIAYGFDSGRRTVTELCEEHIG